MKSRSRVSDLSHVSISSDAISSASVSYQNSSSLFHFTVRSSDQRQISLQKYRGKKAYIIINITPDDVLAHENIVELNMLYKKYHKYLEIIAFPCNDFSQFRCLTSDHDIETFVSVNHIEFPVMGPIVCNVDSSSEKVYNYDITIHPLYEYLVKSSNSKLPVEWNYAKFLCDSKGKVVGRYPPYLSPITMEKDILKLCNETDSRSKKAVSFLESNDQDGFKEIHRTGDESKKFSGKFVLKPRQTNDTVNIFRYLFSFKDSKASSDSYQYCNPFTACLS